MKSFEIEKIQTKKGVEDEMGLTLVEQKTMKVGKGVEEKPGSFIVLKSRKKISFNQGVQAHEVNHRVVDQKSKTVVTH